MHFECFRIQSEQASASKVMFHEEVARRKEDREGAAVELQGLRTQHKALLAQQQSLLEKLSQRDREVSGMCPCAPAQHGRAANMHKPQ